MKPSRIIPLVVLAVFVVGAIIYSENLKTRAQVGAAVPTFELQQLDGSWLRVDASLGMPLIINFWASWCEPCLEEMPAHDAFYRRYRDRIVYVGINEREPPVKIREHLDKVAREGSPFAFPILLDRSGKVGEQFRMAGIPETWFFDGRGIAHFHWLGPVRFEQLEAAYREATGFAIDGADGGPFHGKGGARAVLIGEEPGVLYVGGTGGAARYRLADGGAAGSDFSWQPAAEGGVPVLIRNPAGAPVVITEGQWPGLPAAPTVVAAGHGQQLAWLPGHGLFVGPGLNRAAEADHAPPATGTAGAADASDAGLSGTPWRLLAPADSGLEGVTALAADPMVADRWLAAAGLELLESRDGGRTWRPLEPGVRVYGLAFDPAAPHRLYLATDTGVWVSEDGGRRAVRLAGSPQRVLVALDAAPLPGGGAWLVAAAPNGDVYGSRDMGRTWSLLVPRVAGAREATARAAEVS